MKTQIAALALALGATLAAPLAASAQPYGGYHGGMMGHHDGNFRQAQGRIASVQGSSFTLDNGRTVFMQSGTTINGHHGRLHAGEMVQVSGTGAGNRNINAQSVTVMHR